MSEGEGQFALVDVGASSQCHHLIIEGAATGNVYAVDDGRAHISPDAHQHSGTPAGSHSLFDSLHATLNIVDQDTGLFRCATRFVPVVVSDLRILLTRR